MTSCSGTGNAGKSNRTAGTGGASSRSVLCFPHPRCQLSTRDAPAHDRPCTRRSPTLPTLHNLLIKHAVPVDVWYDGDYGDE